MPTIYTTAQRFGVVRFSNVFKNFIRLPRLHLLAPTLIFVKYIFIYLYILRCNLLFNFVIGKLNFQHITSMSLVSYDHSEQNPNNSINLKYIL